LNQGRSSIYEPRPRTEEICLDLSQLLEDYITESPTTTSSSKYATSAYNACNFTPVQIQLVEHSQQPLRLHVYTNYYHYYYYYQLLQLPA